MDAHRKTLEEMCREASVDEHYLQKSCHDDEFYFYISQIILFDIGLAILLGLEERDIKEIEKNGSQEEKVINMFWRWRKVKGSKATYWLLLEALYKHENIDGVEKVLKKINELQVTSRHQRLATIHHKTQPHTFSDDGSRQKSPKDHYPASDSKTQYIKDSSLSFANGRRGFTDSHKTSNRSDHSAKFRSNNLRETHSQQHKRTDASYDLQEKRRSFNDYKSQSEKNQLMCAKKPDNPAWQIMDRHYNELVSVLLQNEDTCTRLLGLLCDDFIVDLVEKEIFEQLPSIEIKSKAIVEQVSIAVSGTRNFNRAISKLVVILSKFEEMKEIVEKIKNEASSCNIILTTNDKRQEKKITLNNASPDLLAAQCTVTHDDKCINTPAIKKYCQHLKSLYKSWKPDPKWSPVDTSVKIYVDLAIIESGEKCKDIFSRSTIHGTIDDITQQKKPLSFNELCNIPYESTILIDGAPGIGKSMLAYEMCSQWVKGENLTKYTLLLLLRLRDKNIQSLSTVEELLGCFLERQSWKSDVIQDIIDNSGEGVMVIFEGFDELPERLTKTDSPIFALVFKLPLASIIITSRPSARHCLTQNLKFSFHVEVLGFTQDSIYKYIQMSFKGKLDQIKHFQHCLEKSPKVASCLYIPINLAIVCNIFANEHFLPIEGNVTSTKLYEALIKMLLYRHIKSKNPNKLVTIEHLNNLHGPIQENFLKLCKMAYDDIKSRDTRLSFFMSDYNHPIDTLGLMQKEVQVLPSYGDVPIYSFLHLTIQEFLAAFHISQMSTDDINFHFKRYQHVQKFFNMFLFLAGLTKLKSIDLPILPNENFFSMNVFQFLSESENDDLIKRLFSQKDAEHIVSRVLPIPTAHDMFVLGRCVALSKCKWEFGFTKRGLRSEHIEELKKGLSSVPSSLNEINVIRFALNPIGYEGLLHFFQFPEHLLKHVLCLWLKGTDLDFRCVDEFVKHLPKLTRLKELQLYNNNFKEDEQMELIKSLGSLPLESVSFSKLSPTECMTLLTNDNSLKKVELYQLSPLSIEAVLQHLPNAGSLEVLNIKQSECSTDIIVQHLPRALAKCHQLKAIEFANCAIDSSSIPAIIEAVQNAPQITSVSLENNYIDDEGGLALCGMIHRMHLSSHTITELDIRHNPFTEETVHRFIEELLQWTTPFTLYISREWESFKQHEKFIKFQK